MELEITSFNEEIEAGYITSSFEVYSNAPEYIKEMAENINKDYQKSYGDNFFTFVDEECVMPSNNLPPLPEYIIKAREELHKKYKK